MATFQPPPTYAEVVLIDETGQRKPRFNPIWLKWFVDVAAALEAAAGSGGGGLQHNALSGLQGGIATEFYHLSSAEQTSTLALVAAETAILAVANATVSLPHVYTVAGLPAAGTVGQGAAAFVTDATQTIIAGLGLVVAGGGANKVPVYSDGTNWRIG